MKRGLFFVLILVFLAIISYSPQLKSQQQSCWLQNDLSAIPSSQIPSTIDSGLSIQNSKFRIWSNRFEAFQENSDRANTDFLVVKSTSSTESCQYYRIEVSQGSSVTYYGASLEVDGCGNRKVLADNEGNPLSYEEVEQRAQTFVSSCIQRSNEAPPKDTSSRTSRRASDATLAVTKNTNNGLLDFAQNAYSFCNSINDELCDVVSTDLEPLANGHLLDTNIQISSVDPSRTSRVSRSYPCGDMGLNSARAIVKLEIREMPAKFITITEYIPVDWSIAEGTLKTISPDSSKAIEIFSYNPSTREIVIAPASDTQTKMVGSVVYLLQKPDGTTEEHPLGSWAEPFSSSDGTLDFEFKQITSVSSGSCSCWRGSDINPRFRDSDGVVASFNEFYNRGGSC